MCTLFYLFIYYIYVCLQNVIFGANKTLQKVRVDHKCHHLHLPRVWCGSGKAFIANVVECWIELPAFLVQPVEYDRQYNQQNGASCTSDYDAQSRALK